MPAFFELFTTTAYITIMIFIGYYLLHLRTKERELEKKHNKVDSIYRQTTDDALAKEKKILDDAIAKADQIILDAETMSTDAKKNLDQALEKMVTEIKKETVDITRDFTKDYALALKQLSDASVKDFQDTDKTLKGDLQNQLKAFHDQQLATLQKELDEYKQVKFKQTEETITKVIRKVSEEMLGAAIPLEEHQKLLIQSLEKAEKEGMFS